MWLHLCAQRARAGSGCTWGVHEWARPVWTDAEDTFSSKSADTKGQYLFSGQQGKKQNQWNVREASFISVVSIICPRRRKQGHPGPVTALHGSLGRILFYKHQASDKEEEELNIILEILREACIRWPQDPKEHGRRCESLSHISVCSRDITWGLAID